MPQLMVVALTSLPAVVIVFVVVWFVSVFFPAPKPRWPHALVSLLIAWAAVIFLAPYLAPSPSELLSGPGPYLVSALAAGGALWLLPRMVLRRRR